eukprot:TRINITY_DN3321_c0_g1_i4.p1 TRINITY_DN3321_c0_g1~~TRINITY_DN3321_c0_g1_i4.p1  ORF type:complete len:624 (+),score=174.11 TRINITY_DN3321_c0_g1_i4:190-2061(+)
MPLDLGHASAHPLSLRALTRSALEQMLGVQAGPDRREREWTVLILDDFARDVVAPIMRVGDLRSLGITLFLGLHSERQAIPYAPALYLCEPTEAAVRRIAADCVEDMYKSFGVHFLSPVSRPLLELFADGLQPRSTLVNIRVRDQYLSFVSPERDLFSLQVRNSFYTMSSDCVSERSARDFVERTASRLVHVMLTLQIVPVVVAVQRPVAEMLSASVVSKLSDMIREGLLAPSATAHRPVLILCDRAEDIATGLLQPFTYRAMLHDTLGMKLNKIQLAGKSHEVDPSDPLYAEVQALDFGEATVSVGSALSSFTADRESFTGTSEDSDVLDGAERLSSAMAGAGSLAERKRHLDSHVVMCTELNKRVKERQLDVFASLGESIVRGDRCEAEMFEKCKHTSGGVADRVRFGMVHCLSKDPADPAASDCALEYERINTPDSVAVPMAATEVAATQLAPPGAAFAYLRKMRSMQAPGAAAAGGKERGMFGLAGARKPTAFLAAGLKAASSALKGGAAPLWLPHTRVVDAVLQRGAKQERDRFLKQFVCKDPQTNMTVDVTEFKFSTAICFVVGGGNYFEYENMKLWEMQEENVGKRVLYGSTELLTGDGLLQQLAELGKELKEQSG